MSDDTTKNRRKELLERARRIAGDPSWTPPKRGTPEELKARRAARQIARLQAMWTYVAKRSTAYGIKPPGRHYKQPWTTEDQMHAIGDVVNEIMGMKP